MTQCPKCGYDTERADAFCRKCGADLATGAMPGAAATAGGAAPVAPHAAAARKRGMIFSLIGGVVMMAGFGAFALTSSGGCGKVEGSFVSSGKPIGDFTFTPAQCRTGARMNFYGVVLVGNGPTEGGLLVAIDPAQGKFLKIEVPGSCKPPDYEVCTEIMIKPEQCQNWDVDVSGTGVTINEMRMMKGHARADCAFPEGGSVKVNLDFGGCF